MYSYIDCCIMPYIQLHYISRTCCTPGIACMRKESPHQATNVWYVAYE